MTDIFIDGSAGTTGLRLFERLSKRDDLRINVLTGDDRKDPSARKKAINSCDVAFLCLPDDASREAVGMNARRLGIRFSRAVGRSSRKDKDLSQDCGPGVPRERVYLSRLSPRQGRDRFRRRCADVLFSHRIQRRRQKDDRRV